QFVGILPKEGYLGVSASYPNAMALAKEASCQVESYCADPGSGAEWTVEALKFTESGTQFQVRRGKTSWGEFQLPLGGRHNVENALGVVATASAVGLSADEIRRGLASFQGVKRRQEVRAELGRVLVVDDFAHHPTAVRETLAAIHHRYPGRRIW